MRYMRCTSFSAHVVGKVEFVEFRGAVFQEDLGDHLNDGGLEFSLVRVRVKLRVVRRREEN